MRPKIYSFYSESKRAFTQVKAYSKNSVIIYAKEIMNDSIKSSEITILKNAVNSHQSIIEEEYPNLF